jgi:hypothetical protein
LVVIIAFNIVFLRLSSFEVGLLDGNNERFDFHDWASAKEEKESVNKLLFITIELVRDVVWRLIYIARNEKCTNGCGEERSKKTNSDNNTIKHTGQLSKKTRKHMSYFYTNQSGKG